MTEARICALCQQPMRGSAFAGDEWLCHPDDGQDCYRLVTIYSHSLPDGRQWTGNGWEPRQAQGET